MEEVSTEGVSEGFLEGLELTSDRRRVGEMGGKYTHSTCTRTGDGSRMLSLGSPKGHGPRSHLGDMWGSLEQVKRVSNHLCHF